MINVLSTGRLSTQFYEAFKDNTLGVDVKVTDHVTQAQIDWADCLASFAITEPVSLAHVPWIHSFGAGVDGFLKREDLHPKLWLSRTTGKLGEKAAEFCLCHLLNFCQDTFAIYDDMQTKTWPNRSAVSIKATTVLILGTGSMGQNIARFLTALGVTVLGINTTGTSQDKAFARCLRFSDLPAATPNITCIINTLPLVPATQALLDQQFFSRFQQALLINIGRGQTVVTNELRTAMNAGNIAYSVLDVFDKEPLPADSWLWQHPKVFISPHQAAITDIDDVISSFTEALPAYLRQEPNHCFVDRSKRY